RLARHAYVARFVATTRGRHVTRVSAAGGTATATAARAVTARASFDQQASQQPSPRQLSRPSLAATAAMTSAVNYRSHAWSGWLQTRSPAGGGPTHYPVA